MIQVKELMVGDWVLDGDTPRRVIQLTDDLCDFSAPGIILENGAEYEYAVPIPLTAEILEKNGIKSQYGKVWYQLHNDRIQLAWEHNGDTIRLCVDYVHQLQHTLRLCGLNELADDFQVE